MVRIQFDICLPKQSMMDDSIAQNMLNLPGGSGTLQDIAYNLTQEKLNSSTTNDNTSKERTIFVLGSKGVVSLFKFIAKFKIIKWVFNENFS